jgi:hypothetical protein
MNSKSKIKNYFVAALAIFALLPLLTFAAEIRVDSKNQEIKTGEQFTATIFLNTEESINALEGQIAFPADLLELVEIQSGNSIVSFWIDKPKVEADKISFSGIIPGGFTGENGSILSMLFRAKKPGDGSIAIRSSKVLKNDGAGTTAAAITSDFQFAIVEKAPAVVNKKEKDRELPETFRPEIARDESLFDGKWFLVFATQDKASGIDHYEVKESRQKIFTLSQKWVPAESPYILQDQELRSFVFVRAVDKASNKRIIQITPRNALLWYKNYENWIIIIVGVLTLLLAAKKLWRKKHT